MYRIRRAIIETFGVILIKILLYLASWLLEFDIVSSFYRIQLEMFG